MIYKPKFRNRDRRCFELSAKTVIKYEQNKDCLVVYGSLDMAKEMGEMGFPVYEHAWVMDGNTVYDPVKNIETTWENYQEQFGAKIFRKFTREEIAKLAMSNKEFGIFDEIRQEYTHFIHKDKVLECPICHTQFKPYEKSMDWSRVCPNNCENKEGSFCVVSC